MVTGKETKIRVKRNIEHVKTWGNWKFTGRKESRKTLEDTDGGGNGS